jgi:D-serine dehydratase
MFIKEYCRKYPLPEKIIAYEEVLWFNSGSEKKVTQL